MNSKTKFKKALVILLTFMMIFSMLPTQAFAAVSSSFSPLAEGNTVLLQVYVGPNTPANTTPIQQILIDGSGYPELTADQIHALALLGNVDLAVALQALTTVPIGGLISAIQNSQVYNNGQILLYAIDESQGEYGVKIYLKQSSIVDYTVNYEDDGMLLDTKTDSGYIGQLVTEYAIVIANYVLNDTSPKSIVLDSDAANNIITFEYDLNTFTLNYYAGTGGYISGTTPQTVAYGQDGTQVVAMHNPGYSFLSWSDGVLTEARTDTNIMADLSVTAIFDADEFYVRYYMNDGTADLFEGPTGYDTDATVTVTSGVPMRAGYTFQGWATSAGGAVMYTAGQSFTMPPNDVDLYAVWDADSFDVTYYYNINGMGIFNGPTGHNTDSLVDVIEGPAPGSVPGYTFLGWATDPLGPIVYLPGATFIMPPYAVQLYAIWGPNEYNVYFNPTGGTVDPVSKQVLFGLPYGTLPIPERPGYEFVGWFLFPYVQGMPNMEITEFDLVLIPENHQLFAGWMASEIQVDFELNYIGSGTNPSSIMVIFDQEYGPLPEPIRTGYEFMGWYTLSVGGDLVTAATIVTNPETHTLYAHWEANEITVTFDPQGGTVDPTSKVVVFDDPYGTLPTPARAGYTFAGWYTASRGGTLVMSDTIVTNPLDHTLFAHWTANEYTVTFDPQGGSVDPTSKVVTFNQQYGVLPIPSKPGYTFDGWYTRPNAGTLVEATTYVTTPNDHTLYAHWSANEYTVTFDPQGGTVDPTSKVVVFDDPYGTLPTPIKEGYTFLGWFTEPQQTDGVLQTFGVTITLKIEETTNVFIPNDHTLYAHWSANEYTMTYYNNDGTANVFLLEVYQTDELVTVTSSEPTRTGYTFQGWAESPGGVVEHIAGETFTMPPQDLEAYAVWEANTMNVTFNPNGGAVAPTSKVVTYAEAYGALPTPTRGGYTFNGWYTAATGGTQVTAGTIVTATADHTIYAQWTLIPVVITYDVTFVDYDGTILDVDTVVSGGDAAPPADPTREGYSFTGWEGVYTNVTSDRTITAQYVTEAYEYTVTYVDTEGNELAAAKIASAVYGSEVTESAIAIDGYEPQQIEQTIIIETDGNEIVFVYDAVVVPLAAPSWALLNLILMVLTLLMGAGLVIGYFRKKDEDEDVRRKGGLRLGSMIPAIVSVVLFILTEDMTNPMTFVDNWTVVMAIIAAVELVVVFLAKRKTEQKVNPAS